MKVYKRGDNGEFLMHSDTYLGEDYTSPNLVHWKYLRKYEKNGHTYYVYDETEKTLAKLVKDKSVQYIKSQGGISGTIKFARENKNTNSIRAAIKAKELENAYSIVAAYHLQNLKDIPKRIHARAVSFVSSIFRLINGD